MPDTRLVRPSTIASIKRLANRLKRESGIAHHETLNLAARQGGFANYRHAQQQLGAVQPRAIRLPAKHSLCIFLFTGGTHRAIGGARLSS
ncbi:P-loop NTPase family protein [Modicisalibacter luteus]|uniref:hypothetical protein n=1 Tax=Modicisalibacter luteus TaxID=453962 RepID=UPI00363FF074